MKVLFISPNKGLYDSSIEGYNGVGWIAALQYHLERCEDIELAIAFKHNIVAKKEKRGNSTYYPIYKPEKRGFKKLFYYWYGYKKDNYDFSILKDIKEVISDFNPDIIHIFGTESELCCILGETEKPVVVHIQGILNPVLNAYFPPNMNSSTFMSPKYIKEFWLRNGVVFNCQRMQEAAKREYSFIKKCKYFFGRTEWDRSVTELYNPTAGYYHIDEVLRGEFYSAKKWENNASKLTLVSTISSNTYKGLDLVLKTAKLLKERNIDFEWKVIGINNNYFTDIVENELRINYKDVNIGYQGVMDAKSIILLLQKSTIYIHPSYIDNSPNSLCEAQYLGVPCIATNVGGIPTIMNNEYLYMVPANDPFTLAHKIIKLNSDIKENKYNDLFTKVAEERHNPDRIIESIKSSYRHIIKNYENYSSNNDCSQQEG